VRTQAELLERELVSVVTMADKLRIVRGWIKGQASKRPPLVPLFDTRRVCAD
jgi:hypothetical protein